MAAACSAIGRTRNVRVNMQKKKITLSFPKPNDSKTELEENNYHMEEIKYNI